MPNTTRRLRLITLMLMTEINYTNVVLYYILALQCPALKIYSNSSCFAVSSFTSSRKIDRIKDNVCIPVSVILKAYTHTSSAIFSGYSEHPSVLLTTLTVLLSLVGDSSNDDTTLPKKNPYINLLSIHCIVLITS